MPQLIIAVIQLMILEIPTRKFHVHLNTDLILLVFISVGLYAIQNNIPLPESIVKKLLMQS